MRNCTTRCTRLLLGGFTILAAPVHAGGFHVGELDARATGRGGAVIASPGNASSIYYNPAGMADLQGWHAQVGASLVVPTSSFVQTSTEQEIAAEEKQFVLPQAYISGQLSDALSVGLGVHTPYGLAIGWPAESPGRTEVRQSELQTVFITPSFALALSSWLPGLSLGAGLDLVPASVLLSRDIAFGTDYANVSLGGTAFGVGGRAGLTYRPPQMPKWTFGATYRSPVELEFEGQGDFDAPDVYRASLPPDGSVTTAITLPYTVGAGIAFRPMPQWELEFDATWQGWSSYDSLDITLPNQELLRSPKNWRNSLTLRGGGEVRFAPDWVARLGAIWDDSPVPVETLDHNLPSAAALSVTAGLGAQLLESTRLDVAGLYSLPAHRQTQRDETALEGQFRRQAWLVNITLEMRFGAGTTAPEPFGLSTFERTLEERSIENRSDSAANLGAPPGAPRPKLTRPELTRRTTNVGFL